MSPWEGREKYFGQQKNLKIVEIDFSNQERKLESEYHLPKKKDKQEIKVTGGQARYKLLVWEKINLGERENFLLILDVMTYESCEEKRAVILKKRGGGSMPYGSNCTRGNQPPPPVGIEENNSERN